MRGGIGRRLKAIAVFFLIFAFLLVAFAGLAAGKAGARASLRAYLTAGPNTWEMMGFNQTGTAAKYIVDHQGWNVSRTFGNVGIGDGSPRALNLTSNVNDIGYTGNNFIAGDVSTAPWDPARIKDHSVAKENIPENVIATNNTNRTTPSGTEQNASAGDNDQKLAFEKNDRTESEQQAAVGFGEIALNDPYHTMLVGRPVGDILYEHPHAISANMYSRLVGLSMPGGAIANIGMRAIGYGY